MRCCRWVHAPTIHVYNEKRVAWVSISMYAGDPVPIVMGLLWAPELCYKLMTSCLYQILLLLLLSSLATKRLSFSKVFLRAHSFGINPE